MSRRRRILSIAWKVLAILLVLIVYAAWPGRSTFTVSPETTYVTGPLDKDGYVDYVTALNERLSKGITPENNANVLIWQALGPHPEGATMPAEYFKWLGIESPPEQGDYLVSFDDYLKKLRDAPNPERRAELNRRSGRATEVPWSATDQPELADWLIQIEKPLSLFIKASGRPDYYNPLVGRTSQDHRPRLLEALLSNVQVCRIAAMGLACRAMLRVQEGKPEEAWQDLISCHRLGRLLSRGGTLIEMLVGIAFDQIASKADRGFLRHARLTAKQSLGCLSDLASVPAISPVANHLDVTERLMFLDSAMFVVSGLGTFPNGPLLNNTPSNGNFARRLFTRSIKWDPALRKANRIYDRCVALSRRTDRADRKKEGDEIAAEVAAASRQASDDWTVRNYFMGPTRRGESIGDIMLGLFLPAVEKVQTATERNEQTHCNLHLAFALAAFHADAGRYPVKLAELAPKYLDKIPNDLFSNKPLIYKPDGKGYLLYSVGPNGVDDEGQSYDDEPRGDDITVRMPPRDEK